MILGLDVSTSKIGYCVLDYDKNLITHNVMKFKPLALEDRAEIFYQFLRDIKKEYKIKHIFIEQPFSMFGGGEELHWSLSVLFDAMGALSSKYNESPQTASRAYDKNRDGFVIAGGGGTLVLEELEHAKSRNANIYAEIVGYGANSDGWDMVQPSGEGAVRCMKKSLETVSGNIDYINTHGTSTIAGDVRELESIKKTFGSDLPYLSSTKSLTGHSLGATGVQEAIYCLLMMNNNFLTGSANIFEMDESAKDMNILSSSIENKKINKIMSNSFGFGGTNATLVFAKY